jgi:hypothetical protein
MTNEGDAFCMVGILGAVALERKLRVPKRAPQAVETVARRAAPTRRRSSVASGGLHFAIRRPRSPVRIGRVDCPLAK